MHTLSDWVATAAFCVWPLIFALWLAWGFWKAMLAMIER